MDNRDIKNPECPVDESQCQHIDDLVELRYKITELEGLVHTDTLTGLFNYRYFVLALEQELERTRRSSQPISMVMLDLDHFKQVNDTWGHEVGNQVLRQTANIIVQMLRRVDVACRYGGEEFVLILPATPLPRAIKVADRIRQAIGDTPVVVDGKSFTVTASMGVSVYRKGSSLTPEEFTKEADALLYQAKENGRNRIEHISLEEARPSGQVSKDEKDALFTDSE